MISDQEDTLGLSSGTLYQKVVMPIRLEHTAAKYSLIIWHSEYGDTASNISSDAKKDGALFVLISLYRLLKILYLENKILICHEYKKKRTNMS